jgi:hypothetical protein
MLTKIPSSKQTAQQRANTVRVIEQLDRQKAAIDDVTAAETAWKSAGAEVERLGDLADAAMAAAEKALNPTTLAAVERANAAMTAALDANDAAEATYLAARARIIP